MLLLENFNGVLMFYNTPVLIFFLQQHVCLVKPLKYECIICIIKQSGRVRFNLGNIFKLIIYHQTARRQFSFFLAKATLYLQSVQQMSLGSHKISLLNSPCLQKHLKPVCTVHSGAVPIKLL